MGFSDLDININPGFIRLDLLSEDLVDRFLDYFDLCLAVQSAFEICEDFFGVLKGLIVEVEQDKTGVIAYLILDQKILNFSGRSASEVENPSEVSLARYPVSLFDNDFGQITDTVSVRLRRALA